MTSGVLEGLRILLFEDEPLIALDVEDVCRDNGAAEIVTVRRVDDADGLDFAGFDVAVVDLWLGEGSTVPIAAALRAQDVPFVFSSGYSDLPEIAQDFPEITLMTKPYAGERLILALDEAVKSKFSRQS